MAAETLWMRVWISTEFKPDENRVALTPAGDTAFHAVAQDVVVQAGAVRHTCTYTLTNATMAYALETANRGWKEAARDPALPRGVIAVDGRVTHAAVADAHGLEHTPFGWL
jgi:alanine dehydrogenase